ncbi:hypothetical protein EVAR_29946_1 [Eumeta japonica]|uniref:Uncharacterized protein n=1 Tax=Eumeta variegata TaxID=151549 RepID=A0A4C1VJ69_EUMVA|nr:hypothetical protein EVAR_29946_1 [Eumeta japonica]
MAPADEIERERRREREREKERETIEYNTSCVLVVSPIPGITPHTPFDAPPLPPANAVPSPVGKSIGRIRKCRMSPDGGESTSIRIGYRTRVTRPEILFGGWVK